MTEETFPMICSKVLEIEILVKREKNFMGIITSHMMKVEIGHDRSVFVKEYMNDPCRNDQDNDMGYGAYHNWKEFKAMDTLAFHPAAMIEEWAREEGISLTWLGVK